MSSQDVPSQTDRLITRMRDDGMLELRVAKADLPAPQDGEVLVRVEAAPLHPSDLGMMLMAADASRAEPTVVDGAPVLLVPVAEAARPMMQARLAAPPPLGNEGAGTVIAAGGEAGRALIGRRVAAFSGGMYAGHRVLPRNAVTELPDGVSARDGAALSVNPLTALAMVEVMRAEGAKALVHTAAASSLGQILQRVCAKDGIDLVNIVRRPEQAALLREIGAKHVLDSAADDFNAQMVAAFAAVDATIAFDAVGGGTLAGAMLTAMEAAQARKLPAGTVYGSAVPKRVYVYGRLDPSPSVVPPTVGMAWALGGFLLPHFMAGAAPEVVARMTARVLAELDTTFAIAYAREVPLAGLLDPAVLRQAVAKGTQGKILVRPDQGA